MKLSDFLQGVGRPVAYYPRISVMLGGVKQGIFACQFLYWADKGHDEEGWIYKTQHEIELETGLSRREQETARAALRHLGVLEEKYERIRHRMLYRINLDALDNRWNAYQQVSEAMAESDAPESTERTHPNGGNAHSVKAKVASRIRTKNTAENTTKKTSLRGRRAHSEESESRAQTASQYLEEVVTSHHLYESLSKACNCRYFLLGAPRRRKFADAMLALEKAKATPELIDTFRDKWRDNWRFTANAGRPPMPQEILECWDEVVNPVY